MLDSSGEPGAELDERQRESLRHLEDAFCRHWNLGRNVVLSWCVKESTIEALIVPHYLAATFHSMYPTIPPAKAASAGQPGLAGRPSREFIQSLITGTRQHDCRELESIARLLGVTLTPVGLPHPFSAAGLDAALIDQVAKRYSINFEEGRAVFLLDIVGFSLYDPHEQLAQLNSLAYSLNSAHDKMLHKKLDVSFARSTTGDGFYVWNRDGGARADGNLYHLMHLTLADNAIAKSKATGNIVPLLKTAFHVGGYYEIYQAEGLHPTPYNYIVGDITIELARILEGASPGQVLVGDFRVEIPESDALSAEIVDMDSAGFIETLQAGLSHLHGLELSAEKIESIKCYLTGPQVDEQEFSIRKLQITDKHGRARNAYNAKINIYRESGDPIFLGIQDKDLAGFEIAGEVWA